MIKKITIIFIFLTVFISKAQEDRYTITNLKINNSYSNFGTTFYGDDKVVFSAPKKKSYIIRNVWEGNNQPFLELYIGDIQENGQLANVKKFSDEINTRYHEADVAFTKDKKTVYFSRNNYFDGKFKKDSTGIGLIQLYRAKINNEGDWVNIEPMPFNNDNFSTGHPALSADEKTLYFISDMPGGYGMTDIYKAEIYKDGSFGKPENLGPKINTPEREMFVSISGNDELYFSSDGREDGLGGLDLYVSKITEDGFTEPENLGEPMNSNKDDFSFILNYETRRGYFSSNRVGGKGDDDIYTFTQNIPIEFECTQKVEGYVTDASTAKILPGALVTLYDGLGNKLDSMVVGNTAKYNFNLDCNKSYKVIGTKEAYLPDTKEFYTAEGEELNVPLSLMPKPAEEFLIERGKCIVRINPIYFDFDKANIRPDAEIELNKVVDVMNKYPDLIIEGGSHTDSRGTFKYNQTLSYRRAFSTVQYIIGKGIDPSRISAYGYGESQLVNGCADGVTCSEEEHQANRRTEFVIVNYDKIKEKHPEICPTKAITTKEQLEQRKQEELAQKRILESLKTEFVTIRGHLMINTNPIYFDLNSSYFGKPVIEELHKVVEVMTRYPEIIIECGSHTDSRASSNYNTWLSERRAKRIVDYIISKGISPDRIYEKGYGETNLVNNCKDGVKCSDSEHEQNRRTEFVVINPEVIKK